MVALQCWVEVQTCLILCLIGSYLFPTIVAFNCLPSNQKSIHKTRAFRVNLLWSLYIILFLLVSVSYSGNINLILLLFIFITQLSGILDSYLSVTAFSGQKVHSRHVGISVITRFRRKKHPRRTFKYTCKLEIF